MSYQERKTLIMMISGLAISIIYGLYLYNTYPEAFTDSATDVSFWGSAILWLCVWSIGIRIGIMILFSILNTIITREKIPSFSDERDKMIELKSQRWSHYIFILGFLIAMGALALGEPIFMMFVIIFAGGLVGEIVSGCSQLYLYRRGF